MTPTGKTELERAAELWDRTATDRRVNPLQGWLDSPIVLSNYVQPRLSGAPDVNFLVAQATRLAISSDSRWLSLGCGAAGTEILASRSGLFSSMVALDASPASLGVARAAAAEAGVGNIEFSDLDMNHLDLPASAYDVVLMNMSLHHVKDLRSVLSQIDRTLKRTGFFLINEFIGPRQFQFTDRQLQIVRELLDVLPPRWRRDCATGSVKQEYVRMPAEHWNRADPSEAIRSDRIVAEIERRFRVVERIDYGGTILNLLLEHIVHNFDPADEKDVAAVRLLAKTEDLLIRTRALPSDFTVMAMRKRSRLLAPLRGLRDLFFREPSGEAKTPLSSGEMAAAPAAAMADFRRRAHSGEVVRGFHQWEGAGRWMDARGELALRMTSNRMRFALAAPLTELRRRHPEWDRLDVRVQIEEAGTGRGADLDVISATEDRPNECVREVPEPFYSFARGRPVRVLLECERVWVPAETLPGSGDVRRLTVFVMQAGFEEGA
jgi:ubiquinone/menaquinone biosynthesis C-methylase UbiE